MRLGCNTVIFGGRTLPEALERIVWCGFQEVELAALGRMADHLDPTRDDPDEISSLVENAGLKAVAIEAATDLTNPNNLPRFKDTLALASKLGVEVVNTGSGGKSDDADSERAAHAAIREIASYASELGIRVGVKAHVNAAIYNTETALLALDAVPPEGWGINYDASHLFRVGDDVVEAAEKLGSRVVSVHIRDTEQPVIPIGPPPTQIPGRGGIDLECVLRVFKSGGYTGPIDLEIIGTKEYPDWQAVAIAAESRGYLHRLMQTIE